MVYVFFRRFNVNKIQKIALVTAITSAPLLAQAELKPMNDSLMSDISGQSGITLEVGAHVEIDHITYTDTNKEGTNSGAKDGGKLAIKNIAIGGSDIWDGTSVNTNSVFDDMTFDIDINEDGELIVDMTNTTAVDFGVTLGSVNLQDKDGNDSFTLLGRTVLKGKINNLDLTLHKEDKTAFGGTINTDVLQTSMEFNIDDTDLNVAFLGLTLEDVSISGVGSDEYVSSEIDLFQAENKLVIGLSDIAMDVRVGAIKFGDASSASMGQLEMGNLRITNSTLKLSAH